MSHSASNHPPTDAKNWITLFRCETPSESDDICLELAAAGIPYLLPDQAALDRGDTCPEIRIQVTADDYATAKELLFSFKRPSEDPAERNLDAAQVPLSGLLRCLAFLSPLLTLPSLLVVYMAHANFFKKGYKRKADEFACGFLIGVIFWIIVVAVMANRRH